MTITIDPNLSGRGFEIHLGALTYPVIGGPSGSVFIEAMEDAAQQRRSELMGESAATDPVIASVRAAFKAAGKDPSRYRPSSEALTRRIIAGNPLPLVNAAVDIGNVVSVMTGVTVGVYDTAKINGALTLRLGEDGENYETVARGSINLKQMILLADETGPMGTPYSDSARTAVTDETRDILIILYGLNMDVAIVEAAAEFADTLISRFAADPKRMEGLAERLAELDSEMQENPMDEADNE